MRWRGVDGRNHNRRLGKARSRGEADGLTGAQAERAARSLIEKEGAKPERAVEERPRTVNEIADALRERLLLEGARLSYRQNCESMQRVHVSPAFGKRRVATIASGRAPGM